MEPVRKNWLLKIAAIAILLLHPQISPAQGLAIALTNRTACVSWPTAQYYYVLQTNADLSQPNSWGNVGSAAYVSALSAAGTIPWLTNSYNGNGFLFTQQVENARQFYRLTAPDFVSVFSFAVFYGQLLELSDSPTMVFNGSVHANGSIYTGPGINASEIFNGTVTTTGTITSPANAGLSASDWSGQVSFNGKPPFLTNTPAFESGIGTNNPHLMIDMPPAGESPLSVIGLSRFYNQAELLLIVSNSVLGGAPTVRITLQTSDNSLVPGVDPAKIQFVLTNATPVFLQTNPIVQLPFLALTNTFTDQRELNTNMFVTQVDMNQLQSWLNTNVVAVNKFGFSYPLMMYVADQRNLGTNRLAVIRLVNGARLPFNGGIGFTVATPNPLYVLGDYNTTVNGGTYALTLGSTTNGAAVPAALVADAITILSPNWVDGLSASSYISRQASSMTINAAFLTGNVPSTGTSSTTFSGGVQNLTRFLENWADTTLTYSD